MHLDLVKTGRIEGKARKGELFGDETRYNHLIKLSEADFRLS